MSSQNEEQRIIDDLLANWVWVPGWIDSSSSANTAGRIVTFSTSFQALSPPSKALVHCSADTRYKLLVNGARVAVGPCRGSSQAWFYDSIDIAPWLRAGENRIECIVLRYFASSRGAMAFERTAFPGFTFLGSVDVGDEQPVCLDSRQGWTAQVNDHLHFPTGLPDDVFLHINERLDVTTDTSSPTVAPQPYNFKTLNGELSPWRLRARPIPLPEQRAVSVENVRACHSTIPPDDWAQLFTSGSKSLTLAANSSHKLEVQAEEHSTAFLQLTMTAQAAGSVSLKLTYSEGYEHEPRDYPFFRTKHDRLDSVGGKIIGPYDQIQTSLVEGKPFTYEPFWFRTFRVIRVEIDVGPATVEVSRFSATQVNYPLNVQATWNEPDNPESSQIWDVSIRTLRNCMLDGYSDCPFYEQLQYSGDSRAVGLFHYLLCGDDRLTKQAISQFASSITAEGLTQSRFPSHTPQIIAGFSLLWVLQICDHHLFFGDSAYSRTFLPRIDGVLDFFDQHVDEYGLVSSLPTDVWQYVDWVSTWGATAEHPDKGVPVSGRASNRHTYISMVYAYVLRKAATLATDVGRPGHAAEYKARAAAVVAAIRKHCFDGRFFTDSLASIADSSAYSQHCQAWAVLCGAAGSGPEAAKMLLDAFAPNSTFAKCSYMMQFYALRAFSLADYDAYEVYWKAVWDPWRVMLANNMSTWEEDSVRQRSDCHAWGSVPIYEYCVELAGIHPIAPGCSAILFRPRLRLSPALQARVQLGRDNSAQVSWNQGPDGIIQVDLSLERPVLITSQLPGGAQHDHGRQTRVTLSFDAAPAAS